MPFAYQLNTRLHGRKYCIANGAQEAYEGRGSLCSNLSPDMPDIKLITYFNPSTGDVKFTQITEA